VSKRCLPAIALLLCLGATLAQAHHSFTVLFDPSAQVSLDGVVTEFQFIAPHAYIRVDVIDDSGQVVEWEIETTSPGQLIRSGLTPQTLKVGDHVSAVGNPTRDGRPLMRLLTIRLPNGEEKRIQ
jgi:Family of unknown function (DUF6152)